jgi:hypothetical protein
MHLYSKGVAGQQPSTLRELSGQNLLGLIHINILALCIVAQRLT